MKEYKYFTNVKKNAIFTEKECQFCRSIKYCLEGIYFEQGNIDSVCLKCLDEKKACVDIPSYVQKRIKNNVDQKVEELSYTPPVPWIQYNDWPVCCDDFMKYVGEWQQSDFINFFEGKNILELFKNVLDNDTLSKVEDINVLWEDLGYNTAAYVFSCLTCRKIIVVCQSY